MFLKIYVISISSLSPCWCNHLEGPMLSYSYVWFWIHFPQHEASILINDITVTYCVVYRAGTTAQRRRRWHSTVAMHIHPYEGTVTSVLQMDHTICYHIRVGGVGLGVDRPLYVHTWEKWISGLNQAPFLALLLTVWVPVQQRESQWPKWKMVPFLFLSPRFPKGRGRVCFLPLMKPLQDDGDVGFLISFSFPAWISPGRPSDITETSWKHLKASDCCIY